MSLRNTIDNLIDDVNKSDISDSEISIIRDKMKEFEKILKDKSKPKTITISGSCHKMVKEYCQENDLNIGEWVSSVLIKEVEKGGGVPFYNLNKFYKERNYGLIKNIDLNINCINSITEEEEIERIKKKYTESNFWKVKKKRYIKSEILIENDNLLLVGYDKADGFPIYNISGDFDTNGYMVADKINTRSISKFPIDENFISLADVGVISEIKEVTPVDTIKAASLVDFNKNKKED